MTTMMTVMTEIMIFVIIVIIPTFAITVIIVTTTMKPAWGATPLRSLRQGRDRVSTMAAEGHGDWAELGLSWGSGWRFTVDHANNCSRGVGLVTCPMQGCEL